MLYIGIFVQINTGLYGHCWFANDRINIVNISFYTPQRNSILKKKKTRIVEKHEKIDDYYYFYYILPTGQMKLSS